MNKPKSVWNDITKIWGRIAGVIAAVGVAATAIVKIFNTPPELTYIIFAALGLILLIISFYVDKQTEYTHQEIVAYEQKARKDFTEVIERQKTMSDEYRSDTERRIQHFTDSVAQLVETTQETRRDTLRIQLLMIMQSQPDNIDTILKLAEAYFVTLGGDWYMTSEFNKWAKAHEVTIPSHIDKAIDNNHKENKFNI